MKHLILSVVVCVILGVTAGAIQAETKSGSIKFTPGGGESVNIAMGSKMKLNATLNVINVGPTMAVSVKGTVKNTSNVKMNYAYFVAFVDKDGGLIGCHHFALFVDGGKDGGAGTFISLPPEQIARIAYYSVAFYESEKQIGSK